MVKYAGMEITVIRKDVFSHSSLETGDSVGPHGEAARFIVNRQSREKHVQKPLCAFCGKGIVRQGKQA